MTGDPRLLVYKASAGSGKTFTLAVQFIRQLIEDPKAYRRILAVTFTNKATAEMKERILEQLLGIARGLKGSKGYLIVLMKETGKTEEEIKKAAAETLHLILHDYSRFRIETIDSFFQSVMRNLARELELGANLSIELNNTEVLSDAVDSMIEKLDRNSPVLYWMLEHIEERIADDKKWNISDEMKNFGRNIFDEGYVERGEGLRKKLQNPKFIPQYRKEVQELRNMALEQMKGFAEQFTGCLEMHGLTSTDLKGGAKGIGSYFQKLSTGNLDAKVRNTTVEKCLDSEDNWSTKTSSKRDIILQLAVDELIPLLQSAEKFRVINNRLVNSCNLSLRHINSLRLLAHIDAEVRMQNEQNHRFLLSDTNALLHGLISRGDASFVYEKIGTNIDTVMIDEFQDTSRMQWENFHLLLEESLSQKEGSLIVGDIKQSIYRWRNGDWKILAGLGNDPMLRVKECTLDTNWRSERRIIEFNNALFPSACQVLNDIHQEELGTPCHELLQAYNDVRQTPARKENKGYVRVNFLGERENDTYEETTLFELSKEVERLTAMGVKTEEIAILVRKNKRIPDIADYFDKHTKYRIVSDEAFRLEASLAICMMIDGLRWLASPDDRIALARLAVAFQKEVLHKGTDLNHILLNQVEDFLPAEFLLRQDELRLMPLYELLEELFILFNLEVINEQDAYLCAFYDTVTEYLQGHSSELTAFIKAWDEGICEKTIPSGELEGIRILSIHKSKGLEYHTVLIPFCDWKMENETNSHLIWCDLADKGPEYDVAPFNQLDIAPINYSAAMAESVYRNSYLEERLQLWVDNLNLLYVAFTRACCNLVVWCKKDAKGTVAKLLEDALSSPNMNELGTEGLQEEDTDLIWSYGETATSEKVVTKTADNPLAIVPESIPVKINGLKTEIEFRQSNLSADFIRGDENEETERNQYIRQGQLLHKVFASIRTEHDLPGALEQLKMEGVTTSKEEIVKIEALAKKALDNPLVKDWYGGCWNLYNECNIIYHDKNGVMQTKRPDRVMRKGQEVVVVDFKFGKKKKEYNEQVKEYMTLLHQMGYTQVKGFLWYVYTNELDEIE